MTPEERWTRAYQAFDKREDRRRDEMTEQLIAEAKATPTDCCHAMFTTDCKSCATMMTNFNQAPVDSDSLTLTGAELVAYRTLHAAARAAHEAQQLMATTGVALREAIAGMCAVIAPAKE